MTPRLYNLGSFVCRFPAIDLYFSFCLLELVSATLHISPSRHPSRLARGPLHVCLEAPERSSGSPADTQGTPRQRLLEPSSSMFNSSHSPNVVSSILSGMKAATSALFGNHPLSEPKRVVPYRRPYSQLAENSPRFTASSTMYWGCRLTYHHQRSRQTMTTVVRIRGIPMLHAWEREEISLFSSVCSLQRLLSSWPCHIPGLTAPETRVAVNRPPADWGGIYDSTVEACGTCVCMSDIQSTMHARKCFEMETGAPCGSGEACCN